MLQAQVVDGGRARCAAMRWVALCCACGVVASAWAQDTVQHPTVTVTATPLPYRQFDAVALTGSSILSARSKEALPVTVITRRDIERSGAASTAELVQGLTAQINGFQAGLLASGIAESGPEAAAIHGLQSATLVLLNGRRLPAYARPTLGLDRSAVDLDLVPMQAIERIELMNDGASARYGSDAIAGVINIIMREGFEGAVLGAQLTHTRQGAGANREAWVSLGQGDFRRDGWDWQLHGAMSKQSGLSTADRSAAQRIPSVGDPADGRYYAANFYQLTRYGWPATLAPRLNSWGSVGEGTLLPQAAMVEGQCADGWVAINFRGERSCWWQKSLGLSLLPQQDRAQLWAKVRRSLGPNWALFGEWAWSRKRSLAATDSAASSAWYQPLSGGRWAFASPLPLGPERTQHEAEQSHLSLGLKGQWRGWDTELTHVRATQRAERWVAGPSRRLAGTPSFADKGLTEAELSTPLGEVSASTWAKLAQGVVLDLSPIDAGQTQLQSWSGLASKVLAHTDAGELSLGLGLSWQRETLHTEYYDLSATSPRSPSPADTHPPLNGAREVAAAHAELALPLSPRWRLNVHARHDRYSDVGAVSTGKLALRWQPNARWVVRGSWGTGFRAPQSSQVMATRAYLSSQGSRDFYAQGNPALRPERSVQATVGARYEPSPRWSLGGDYWRLHIRDQLFVPDQQFVVNYPEWAARVITPNAQGGEDFALQAFNLSDSWREGIDYALHHRYPSAWGRWRLSWRGTRYLRADTRTWSAAPKVSLLGVAQGVNYSYVPRDKLSLQLALERPRWSSWLNLNYLSGNREYYNVWDAKAGDRGVGDTQYWREVPAFWTLDFGVRWAPDAHHLLTLHINNVLDQYPPFRALSYPLQRPGTHASYGSFIGRSLSLRYRYRF